MDCAKLKFTIRQYQPVKFDVKSLKGVKVVGKLQNKIVTPTLENQTILADTGFDALKEVNVLPVTASIDNNIQPENIKLGVEILGVAGNVAPDKPDQDKIVTPTKENQLVTGDTGYELASVIVKAIPDEYANVGDTTATAETVASGKVFYDNNGVRTEGVGNISSGKDMLQARVDAVNSCESLFYMYGGDNVDYIANLDTTNIKNFSRMFSNCQQLKTIPLLDTSNGTVFMYMFYLCNHLTDVPQLDTGNGTVFTGMFKSCGMLKTIPQLDTSNAVLMDDMFNNSQQLETIPLLNTSKVTTMKNMFANCYRLKTIPLLDTSNVTDMSGMFDSFGDNLSSGEIVIIPQLDTSKVTNMNSMFRSCDRLITIPPLDTSNVTDTSYMFYSCKQLIEIPPLDTRNAKTIVFMFYDCPKIQTIPLIDFRSNTSNNVYMFSNNKELTNLTVKNVNAFLQIGYGTNWGTLLTDESLINTAKELWDMTGKSTYKLTVSTPSNARFDAIYVKLVDVTDEMLAEDEYANNKKPCVVCASTDEGAMTLREYVVSKNWALA